MYDLVSIGDIKLDAFILIPDATVSCALNKSDCQICIPYGKKNIAAGIQMEIAGSAPNVATALARAKKKTAVVSYMGHDAIYRMAIEELAARKIDTRFVKTDGFKNSSFAAVLNFKGESTQLVSHTKITFDLPKNLKTQWLHVSELGSGYGELFKSLTALAKAGKTKISFNPGSLQIKENKSTFRHLLAATEILFVNKHEAEVITGSPITASAEALIPLLHQMGPNIVVVTDGQNGAWGSYEGNVWHAPMFPGKRVEATGAGDAFASGTLTALIKEKSLEVALKWGSVMAASVVGKTGPTAGLLTPTELQNRLKKRPSYKTKKV